MQAVGIVGQWWNLIFVVPFCMGVMLVLMSLLGTGRHGRSMHRGGRVTYHAKTAHVKGHKVAKAQRHGEQFAEPHGLMHALHLQNLPSQMLLQNFLLFWGVVGWTCNQIAAKSAAQPTQFIITSLLVALAGGFICTLVISATLARFTPGDESFAITKAQLEGHIGEAISAINECSGSVRARDDNGTLHQMAARIRSDDESIARGQQVLLVSYFADDDYFQVKKWTA